MSTHRFCQAALLVSALGCASAATPATGSTASTNAAPAKRRNVDVITAEELTDPSVNTGNVLDAIRRLRPQFLATRGSMSVMNSSAGSTHVSIDGSALQAMTTLSQMQASEVAEIRYLSPSDAAQRFGTGAASGAVILVKRK